MLYLHIDDTGRGNAVLYQPEIEMKKGGVR